LANSEDTASASYGGSPPAIVRADGRLPAAQARSGPFSGAVVPAMRSAPAILRIVVPLAIILVAATIVGLGFVLARQADDRAEAGHRQALRGAVEALQAVAPDLSGNDPRIIECWPARMAREQGCQCAPPDRSLACLATADSVIGLSLALQV
jgi:hypothetical protein